MDPGDARRLGAPAIALLATATAIAALLRFWGLGRQGFWYDEVTTAWLLRGTPGQLLAQLPHTESTPPLYYLLAWGWVRVFGDHEAGLRSLSALAGVATAPVAFAAARTLAGQRVALFAAALVAVNPFLVWYSQEARSYALLVLASAVTLWLFARARVQPSRGRLVAWAAAAAVAICIHYFALFVVLPEGLLLLADRRSAARWKIQALAVVAVPAIALLVLANAQRGRTYYFARSPLLTRVEQIPQFFVVGFTPPAGTLALATGGLAVIAAIALLAGRKDLRARRGAVLAGVVGLSAVLVPVLLAVAGADYLNARNVIGAVVPLVIAVACGLATRHRQALGLGVAALLVAVSVTMVVKVPDDPGAQRTHWQQVAQALPYTGKPRAILLLGAHTWSRILGFYLPHTWWDPPHGFRVAQIDVLRRSAQLGPCPAVVWWGAACDSAPRAQLRRPPAPGFRLVSDVHVAGFAIDRYVSPRPVRLYSRQPLERYTSLDRASVHEPRSRLMVMPTRSPVLP